MDRRDDRVLSALNELIETCRDGEYGFRHAADHVRSGEVKELFQGYATQRRHFAGELEEEVRRLGGEPEKGGSTSGALHRGWMDVKDAVAMNDDQAVVAEAERGEDVALQRYREALDGGLPPPARTTVQRQFSEVRQAHDRVRALERSLKGE